MLASIILDAYELSETSDVAYAVMRLCSPPNRNIFSRVGVYAFWDFDTREILYIGLSSDVLRRFLEHSGVLRCQETACKYREIEAYFKTHTRLGFSLFLQSKMHDDGLVPANPDPMLEEAVGVSDALKNAIFAEGALIRQYRTRTGDRPKWNRNDASLEAKDSPLTMRGSRLMREIVELAEGTAPPPPVDVLGGLVGRDASVLVSRHTARQIVTDYRVECIEDSVHAIRMYTMTHAQQGKPLTWEEGIELIRPGGNAGVVNILSKSRYLDKTVPFSE